MNHALVCDQHGEPEDVVVRRDMPDVKNLLESRTIVGEVALNMKGDTP